MKRTFKTLISLILVLTLSFSVMVFSVKADETLSQYTQQNLADVIAGTSKKSSCGNDCPYAPSIVIHGIGQSDVTVLDENGEPILNEDGKPVKTFPPQVDAKPLIGALVTPLVTSFLRQKDDKLSDALLPLGEKVLKYSACDLEGNHIYNNQVYKYYKSVAACTPAEQDIIYKTIPLNAYAETAGEDHLYFFAYDSFGNILDIAAELAQFIELVKKETGHDKVNLIPISLGGTVANALFETQKSVYPFINKIVYIVPAVDGSKIIGDIFTGRLNTGDDALYTTLFPGLIDGYMGHLVNILIRFYPKQTILNLFDALGKTVSNELRKITNMWALCPSDDYEEAAANYLVGDEFEYLRNRTEIYHQAQLNRKANLQTLIDDYGVKVFDIVDYDFNFYNFIESEDEYNADGVIHVNSTSFDSFSVPLGQTLGEDYTQANTYCSDPSHNHISPSGTLDASAGYFCETTWYFKGQDHERTGSNDIIIRLAIDLISNDDITNVHSSDFYPQFMDGRNARNLYNTLLPLAYQTLNAGGLTAGDKTELEAAAAAAEVFKTRGTDSFEDFSAAETRLNNILVKLGKRQAPTPESFFDKMLDSFFTTLDNAINKMVGPRGFIDTLPGRK